MRTQILTIRTTKELKEELLKLAILDKRSLNNYCELVFDEHIERKKDQMMNSKK